LLEYNATLKENDMVYPHVKGRGSVSPFGDKLDLIHFLMFSYYYDGVEIYLKHGLDVNYIVEYTVRRNINVENYKKSIFNKTDFKPIEGDPYYMESYKTTLTDEYKFRRSITSGSDREILDKIGNLLREYGGKTRKELKSNQTNQGE
jgi:hypothetical protein